MSVAVLEAAPSASPVKQPATLRIATSPLEVKAKAQGQPMKDGTFKLAVSVTNTSSSVQKIQVMSYSWQDSWQASDPDVVISESACFKNTSETITLRPKERYERVLDLYCKKLSTKKSLRFRMGFDPQGAAFRTLRRASSSSTKPGDASNALVWSNVVTVG